MEVLSELLPGVLELRARRFGDDRGWFSETYNQEGFAALGISQAFVQDNQSFSALSGTVRGLHLQLPPSEQGKLVRVLQGSIFDVAVDIDPTSATYRQHASITLSAEAGNLLWVPPGYAHGFCTLEPDTMVFYKVTALYDPTAERSILWNDPEVGIDWPVEDTQVHLSDKDKVAPLFSDADWTSS